MSIRRLSVFLPESRRESSLPSANGGELTESLLGGTQKSPVSKTSTLKKTLFLVLHDAHEYAHASTSLAQYMLYP